MTIGALTPELTTVILGVIGLLAVASSMITAVVAGNRILGSTVGARTSPMLAELALRIRSWWIIAAGFGGSLTLGRTASVTFLALVSFLVLREYLTVAPFRTDDRIGPFVAYASIPVYYGWIAFSRSDGAAVVQLLALAAVGIVPLTRGLPREYLRSSALAMWGILVAVIALGHLALIVVIPASSGNAAGGLGLLLYLVCVVQTGDVAQYVAGKCFGKTRAVPWVSPNKTHAGYLGGLVATSVAAVGLAGYLTPLSPGEAALVGPALSLVGCLGGLMISALKRDVGVKDMGDFLPGHGGVLDRVDSLVFAAPFFYHYLALAH